MKKSHLILIMTGFILIISYISIFYILDYIVVDRNDVIKSLINIVIFIIIEIASFFVIILVSTIIHELGHLIFGKISGYHLISFRILNFVYANKKIRIKKSPLKMIKGQCLMYYKNYNKKAPYRLFLIGGVVFNAIFGAIAIDILLLDLNLYANIFALNTIIITFYLLFINLTSVVPFNDGSTLRIIKHHPECHKAFFDTLRLAMEIESKILFEEILIDDYSEESIIYPITLFPRLLKYHQMLKINNYQKAEQIMDLIYKAHDNYPLPFQATFLAEYLSYQVIIKNNANLKFYYRKIPLNYTKILEESQDVSVKRGFYFYYLYTLKDEIKAKKLYDEAIEIINKEELTSYNLFLRESMDYQLKQIDISSAL